MKVVIAGATGETGRSVVDGLLKSSRNFEVIALTRPASSEKPAVQELRGGGVKVVPIDLQGDQKPVLDVLTGVDVVISTLHYFALEEELKLSVAAKEAGVKRYVPCFFATAAPRGVMTLRNRKEDVLSHIQRLHLPYTVIDVGWWYEILLPRVPSGRFDYALVHPINSIFAGGDNPIAITDVRDVGTYVARIIADPSTINKKVFACTETKTQNQVFELVEKLTGERIERTEMSAAELDAQLEQLDQDKLGENTQAIATLEYWRSWGIRGDNTPEYAKYLGRVVQ